MKDQVRRWLASCIYWGVVLASLVATVHAATKVIRDQRGPRVFKLSTVSLDGPPRANVTIRGRALLINLTDSKVWVALEGISHFWLVRSARAPERIMPDAIVGFRPCGAESVASEAEAPPGPSWWCFKQEKPTFDEDALEQLRNPEETRLWFAALITFRTGNGRTGHARVCLVYNFEAGRFEKSRRGSCDRFY